MNNIVDLIDHYIASWNETDAQRRRDLIARTWTERPTYADPSLRGEGQPGIDTVIQDVQARFPEHRFRRTSAVDTRENRVRFAWELGPNHGLALARGVDFGVIIGKRLQAIDRYVAIWNEPNIHSPQSLRPKRESFAAYPGSAPSRPTLCRA